MHPVELLPHLDGIERLFSTLEGKVTLALTTQIFALLGGFASVAHQTVELTKGIKGTTQDRLYAQYGEICKLFMEKPYLRPYFYEIRCLKRTLKITYIYASKSKQ